MRTEKEAKEFAYAMAERMHAKIEEEDGEIYIQCPKGLTWRVEGDGGHLLTVLDGSWEQAIEWMDFGLQPCECEACTQK